MSKRLCWVAAMGPVPSPFDCFLANRGLKTLHVRMREHERNASAVAKFLEGHPNVQEVMYPGMLVHAVTSYDLCYMLSMHAFTVMVCSSVTEPK